MCVHEAHRDDPNGEQERQEQMQDGSWSMMGEWAWGLSLKGKGHFGTCTTGFSWAIPVSFVLQMTIPSKEARERSVTWSLSTAMGIVRQAPE